VSAIELLVQPRDGEPFRHEVRGEAVVLGRSSKADVVVADRYLSRQHARIFQREGGWFLEDLGSRNTTFLNERPLAGAAPVRPGDVIRLAESRIVVTEPGAEAPPAMGDGLTGAADEGLPASTIFRPASALIAGPAATGEDSGVAARLRVLNEVHRALAAPITLAALLDLILDRAFAHLQPEEGAVFLRDAQGVLTRAAMRRAPGVTGEPLYSRALAREVTEKGVAALVMDASLDQRFAMAESIMASGMRSLLAAPLLDSEGCLGMIVLSSKGRLYPFQEADLELLAALAAAAAMRIRNIELAEETARRRLLDRELDLAHDIQMAMLPRSFPHLESIDVNAVLRPARTVGGDLYDVIAERGRVWLLVGDVSGKGVGAALFMAVTKTLFRAIAPGAASIAEVVARVSSELARDNERAMFVTAFVARLDLQSGELEYINAGHSPTYRIGAGGALLMLAGPVDPPLGAVDEHAFRSSRQRLSAGDALLLYTDGIVEAHSAAGDEFQTARLEQYLAGCGGVTAARLVQGLLQQLDEFVGDTPQYDDVTVLALRWLGPSQGPQEAEGEGTLPLRSKRS
jgi:serine phosphatase RsbU (regulator of sigma subunit)